MKSFFKRLSKFLKRGFYLLILHKNVQIIMVSRKTPEQFTKISAN